MSNVNHELSILSIKLKEKDQEVKLNDLKIKELKKQIPNTKLKPIKRSKDKTNQSVDDKRLTHESLVSGKSSRGTRKIIRDSS